MKRALLGILLMIGLSGCTSPVVDEAPPPEAGTPMADAWPVWGALENATVRPGASLGNYCTFNFLFEGPNGTGYIGTAAHCTDELGERVETPGVGNIGSVVYDSDLVDSGVDFALVRLDDEQLNMSHPMMLGSEGPTGWIETANLTRGDRVHLHGYGFILGENGLTRDRAGVLVDWNDDEYNVDMPAVNGDSGAPLLHESGLAFGIVSRYGIANMPPSTDQGPLMDYIFRELAAAGYGDVRLATI